MRHAIFDLGSNSVKYLVGEPHGKGVQVIQERSVATRLATDLIRTGHLDPEAIERTLTVLKELRKETEDLGATHFSAVATSAVRDSANRKEFLKAARDALGVPVRLLSGPEEAGAIFTGVAADPQWRGHDLFVTDVGGGSAEWIEGTGGKISHRLSLPLGCVRLRERFIPHYPCGPSHLSQLLSMLHEQLQPALAHLRLHDRACVATGGTATCLGAMHLKLTKYDPSRINHLPLLRPVLFHWMEKLKTMNLRQLKAVPGLPAKRIDLILPGIAVLYVTMEIIGAHKVILSTRGLRNGIIHQLLFPK